MELVFVDNMKETGGGIGLRGQYEREVEELVSVDEMKKEEGGRKEKLEIVGVKRTEEPKLLDPADLLFRAKALIVHLVAEVSQVMQLKQVDHRDVDQLLGTERLLKNQLL